MRGGPANTALETSMSLLVGLMYLGNSAAIEWKREATPRPKMSVRPRRARDRAAPAGVS